MADFNHKGLVLDGAYWANDANLGNYCEVWHYPVLLNF